MFGGVEKNDYLCTIKQIKQKGMKLFKLFLAEFIIAMVGGNISLSLYDATGSDFIFYATMAITMVLILFTGTLIENNKIKL